MPIVIAVGDQSSGKSSIMSRILGHSLPTKSGICTRIPARVSTRRDVRETEVILVSKEAKSDRNYYEGDVASAVSQCQEEAMQGKFSKFSADHMVDVSVGNHKYDLSIFYEIPN